MMRAGDTRGDSCRSDDAVVRAVVMALVPLVFLIGSKNRDELVPIPNNVEKFLIPMHGASYLSIVTTTT